jgi:hypothetical protein
MRKGKDPDPQADPVLTNGSGSPTLLSTFCVSDHWAVVSFRRFSPDESSPILYLLFILTVTTSSHFSFRSRVDSTLRWFIPSSAY